MFGKRTTVDKERAESAERLLAIAERQLAQSLEQARRREEEARRDREFLTKRIEDLERNAPSQAERQRAREDAIRREERERALTDALRALEPRAKQAERVPELEERARALDQRAREVEADAARLVDALARLAGAADALGAYGVKVTLAPRAARGSEASALRAATQAVAASADAYAALARSLNGIGAPTRTMTDAEALAGQARFLCRGADVEAAKRAVLEQADLWMRDPKLRTYHVELLQPYAAAVRDLLERRATDASVEGARLAMRLVRDAQRESAGYLLRRSAALDGHVVRPALSLERYLDDPAHAVSRLSSVIQNAHGLGALDFFQNLARGALAALRAGEPGARTAAWLLSDVTVAVLEDKRVREWLAQSTT